MVLQKNHRPLKKMQSTLARRDCQTLKGNTANNINETIFHKSIDVVLGKFKLKQHSNVDANK